VKVLIVGGGAREHTLAWACAKSPDVSAVFVAPGNAGTALEPKCTNVEIGVNDFKALAKFVVDHTLDLTIIGPEDPLVKGIKDYFDQKGLLCLGPSAAVAQLEGSKSFAKQFMSDEAIPTASYFATTDLKEALDYLESQSMPIVVKADGLAAGKGVVIAQDKQEAIQTVTEMLSGVRHGDAGRQVVIEEFMTGEEASYTVLIDGTKYLAFANSQDHKPIGDGDTGPNTGGMGAYSPAPVITPEIEQKVLSEIVEPVVSGMARRNTPYVGFLYVGLMITPENEVKVVEFNCRFGDPETQVVLYRLRTDFAQICLEAAKGQLRQTPLENSSETALCVVMASGGYPGAYETGKRISGLGDVDVATKVFHAGTKMVDGNVCTSGGRVLGITALGDTVEVAQRQAYQSIQKIRWEAAYNRTDIGFRAVNREK